MGAGPGSRAAESAAAEPSAATDVFGAGGGSAAAGGAVGGTAGDGVGGVGTRPVVPSTVVEMFCVVLDDEMVTVCVEGPSSPGLRTRTETEMLHPEQPAAAGPAASVPQLQFQFQSQPPEAGPGLLELVPPEGSEQFQFQFQVQLDGGLAPDELVFGD